MLQHTTTEATETLPIAAPPNAIQQLTQRLREIRRKKILSWSCLLASLTLLITCAAIVPSDDGPYRLLISIIMMVLLVVLICGVVAVISLTSRPYVAFESLRCFRSLYNAVDEQCQGHRAIA